MRERERERERGRERERERERGKIAFCLPGHKNFQLHEFAEFSPKTTSVGQIQRTLHFFTMFRCFSQLFTLRYTTALEVNDRFILHFYSIRKNAWISLSR